jgi:hypothetical protein
MREIPFLVLAVALGAATVMSSAADYDLAARTMHIQRTPSAEVLKVRATQQAVLEQALERPTLPVGMAIVLPGERSRG